MKFGCIGLDHRHIYGMTAGMIDAGAECVGYYTDDSSEPIKGFQKCFPKVPRVTTPKVLLDDHDIRLVLCAAIPNQRADFAIEAMLKGKDVMVDKPGVISFEQLKRIKEVQKQTGALYSIDFSEHFEVPSALKAKELIDEGLIGDVIHTIGLGPHRHNRHLRRPWFYQKKHYGGIIIDIASHQIDQFLWLTNSEEAEIASSSVGNYTNKDKPEFEDFGEVLLKSKKANGYIRVDWYTPDTLPTWGDGRLFIQGTKGYIEIRKYVDIKGKEGKDHLFLVTDDIYHKVNCEDIEIKYFKNFYNDILNRTQSTMTHKHCFKVCELALQAQVQSKKLK